MQTEIDDASDGSNNRGDGELEALPYSSTMNNPVLPEEVISLDDYLAIIDVIIQPCFTQGEDSDGFGRGRDSKGVSENIHFRYKASDVEVSNCNG